MFLICRSLRTVALWLACSTQLFLIVGCKREEVAVSNMQESAPTVLVPLVVVYRNDFNGPVGSEFPEWKASAIRFHKTVSGEKGSLPAHVVSTVESPNRKERFLGEFGGPPIGRPGDQDWNRTRVDQTVALSLTELSRHTRVAVAFDLYILKSWDGNSRAYGPDRFLVRVRDGGLLLDTTFSNNPKVREDGSYQSYPAALGQTASNAPQSGAASLGTLGYSNFFKDSVYHLAFEFPHHAPKLTLEFSSSLFEGKGPKDESWGLDNVVIRADVPTGTAP